jgi:outer membrane protein assembly factor BamA
MQCSAELATPPGDVGFVKGQAAVAGHLPIGSRIMALHVSLHAGYLHHTLNFGGLCNAPTVSDRFLLGGTGSFRGFVPAGIGPRSTNNNNKVGDALGGTFFYMATAMASLAPPTTLQSLTMLTSHVRLFGFCTAGTCLAKLTSVSDVVYSTRASAGFGVATQAMGPRLEATYAWPLRYGPLDGRRRFQFGMSFSI